MATQNRKAIRARIHARIRRKLSGTPQRPRLAVYFSNTNVYAQIIDDAQGRTLAAASSLEKEMRGELRTGADKDAAVAVGRRVAERAVAAGVSKVVFDRGPYLYHGRVKALADAAREGGLDF